MSDELDRILHPKMIREKAEAIYSRALQNKTHFEIHESKIKECAAFVAGVIEDLYPNLNIPFHSRFRHFEAGKVNRLEEITNKDPVGLWDLCIISVFLDAGAGEKWSYQDPRNNKFFTRSEGLAVATFDMFKNGFFSINPKNDPWRVDAEKLKNLSFQEFKVAFQESATNELLGIESRFKLIQNLASALLNQKNYFEHNNELRPGNLFSYIIKNKIQKEISAVELLKHILLSFQDFWPQRLEWKNVNFGDVWMYAPLATASVFDSLVPFHKLSQWLCYSLLDPLQTMGYQISDLNQLTGLPEYRNGGLFLDEGVLELRNKSDLRLTHEVDSELIVEWRALTICLLDRLAVEVRKIFNKNEADWPLVKILEGGTWHAGRKSAQLRRGNLNSPLNLVSDGTVF
jgi:hypothetical protein